VRRIYKICPASAWRGAERQGVYRGSADDTRDGFIHFSQAAQVAETARKHFAGQTGLFLVAVDADALGAALRFEPSRNDELFPHLYGELDLGAVVGVQELHARSDGFHDIPELEP
jgi:uncharacterized protein (DUF952 family)